MARIEDLCHAGVSHKKALPRTRLCRQCPRTARLYHQRPIGVTRARADVDCGAWRSLQHCRSHWRPLCVRSRRARRASQKHNPDWLIFSLPLLSLDAVRLCVASSNASAARGDAVQAAFERKTSHNTREIPDLRERGNVYQPLVWTADGGTHPAATRTLQYAADHEFKLPPTKSSIASSSVQHISKITVASARTHRQTYQSLDPSSTQRRRAWRHRHQDRHDCAWWWDWRHRLLHQ